MISLRKLPVSGKILLGYAGTLVILLVLAVLVYQGLDRSIEAAGWVRHTQDVLLHDGTLSKQLVDMETGTRGFVITGDDAFLEPYNVGRTVSAVTIAQTLALVSDNPGQEQRMQAIAAAVQDWQRQHLEPTIQARRGGADQAVALVASGRGKAMLDQIRRQQDDFAATEQTLLVQRAQDEDGATRRLQFLVVGGTALAALLGLAGSLLSARSIAQRVGSVARGAAAIANGDLGRTIPTVDSGDEIDALGASFNAMTDSLRQALSTKVEKESLESVLRERQTASAQLASTASQILGSVNELGATTNEQAAAITQTTATVDEVTATSQQVLRQANGVASMATQASEVAQRGLATVDATVTAMQDIRGRVESIAEQMLTLSEQTQQVGEITTTVDDLADQSNLLAVNAAIEAARAGEQGRGFAVVAQEVRSLAERSKTATVQVRTILGEIQRATNAAVLATEQGTKGVIAGSAQVEQAGLTIRQLANTIRESSEAAQQIVASVGQHGAGMEQIAAAMTSINKATNGTAGGARQLQEAAGSLNDMAQRLASVVGENRPISRAA
jgi:methyl-accepting chemotaxis protein